MFPSLYLSWGSICFKDNVSIVLYCLQMDDLRSAESCELAVAAATTAAAACPPVSSALSINSPHSSPFPILLTPSFSSAIVLYLFATLLLLLARRWRADELRRTTCVWLGVYFLTVAVAGWEGMLICLTMVCAQYGLWLLGTVMVLLSLSQRCLTAAANPWVNIFTRRISYL